MRRSSGAGGPATPVAPPSGHPPPRSAELADGATIDLESHAREITRRFLAEFPDERERYGEASEAWCAHDNQHLLNWAALETRGYGDMGADVRWLAGVLDARGYPLDRLARNLDIAADVVADAGYGREPVDVAGALRRAGALVRDAPGAEGR